MRKMRDSFHLLVVYFFLQQDFEKDFNLTILTISLLFPAWFAIIE